MELDKKPIILIDDDQEDLDLIREVVGEMKTGNEIITFTDPVKALSYFKENKVDAFFILCDLNMPKINGLQLREEMISYPSYDQQTPFYLLSTGNTSRERSTASGLNVADYLIKPTSYTGIQQTLDIIFRKSGLKD